MSDGEQCRQRPADRGVECPDCGGHLFVERPRGRSEDWICHGCGVAWNDGDQTAAGTRQYQNKTWLRARYRDDVMTVREIAALCDVLPSTIYDWLDRHDIETRTSGGCR
jgi:hypothetical protein